MRRLLRAVFTCVAIPCISLLVGNHVASSSTLLAEPMDPNAKVTTLAGSGSIGEDDGSREAARFAFPTGVAFDSKTGFIYVADAAGQRIRRIAPDGSVSTIAGSATIPVGAMYAPGGYRDGAARNAAFYSPSAISIAPDGSLYVADKLNHCIRRIQSGIVTTVVGKPTKPGSIDGAIGNATMTAPQGIAFDADGTMYVADHGVGVRIITKKSVITLKNLGKNYVEGVLSIAVWPHPHELFISGYAGIVRYDLTTKELKEIVRPIQQPAGIWPYAIKALNADQVVFSSPLWSNVFFADFGDGALATNPFVRPLIGQMEEDVDSVEHFADGLPRDARLAVPMGIALDDRNNIIVADAVNRRIRRIPAINTRWALRDPLPLPEEPDVFRIIFVSNSFGFWNCMWSDSAAGTLERELNAHRSELGIIKPIKVYAVRINGELLSPQANYIENVVPVTHSDLVVWSVNPFSLASSNMLSLGVVGPSLESLKKTAADVKSALDNAHTKILLVSHPTGIELGPEESTVYRASEENQPNISDLLSTVVKLPQAA